MPCQHKSFQWILRTGLSTVEHLTNISSDNETRTYSTSSVRSKHTTMSSGFYSYLGIFTFLEQLPHMFAVNHCDQYYAFINTRRVVFPSLCIHTSADNQTSQHTKGSHKRKPKSQGYTAQRLKQRSTMSKSQDSIPDSRTNTSHEKNTEDVTLVLPMTDSPEYWEHLAFHAQQWHGPISVALLMVGRSRNLQPPTCDDIREVVEHKIQTYLPFPVSLCVHVVYQKVNTKKYACIFLYLVYFVTYHTWCTR